MPSNFNQLPYKYKKFINAEALLEFDGANDVINLGDFQGILQNGTDFSVEIIFSTSKVTTGTLISKNSLSGSSARGFQISLTGGNALTVVLGGEPATFAQQISLPTVQRNALYHLVVGVNSGNFFAYLNGTRRVNVAYTGGDYNNTADLVIGKPTDGTTFHEGTIGLCRFYNRALDRDEIIHLSNNPFLAPASVHENNVAEYIPQRSYFKDASNIYGKGANAILWFDSSEQYNYAKGSPVSANHGVMTGWGGAEVVTTPEPSSVIDFYDKTSVLADEQLDYSVLNLLRKAEIDGYTAASGTCLAALDSLIRSLKVSGVWNLLDTLWLPATNGDRDFAGYNIKNPEKFSLIEVDTPTFTSLEGFSGNATSSYLKTQFIPSSHGSLFKLNNASISFYRRSVGAGGTKSVVGARGAGSNGESSIIRSGLDVIRINRNDTGNPQITKSPIQTGLILGNRINSTTQNLYLDGSFDQESTVNSGGLSDIEFYILAANNGGFPVWYNDDQISFLSLGGDLTDFASSLYSSIQTYMTAIGKEV